MTHTKKHISVLLTLMMLVLSLIACDRSDEIAVLPTETATSEPTATNTLEPTVPPTATNTATPEPTNTPRPTNTPTVTASATPTEEKISMDEVVIVKDGGFSYQPPTNFLSNVQGTQAGITSKDDEILIFFATNESDSELSLQEVLDNFVSAAGADMGELIAGDSYPFTIENQEGLATDVVGNLLGDDFTGQIALVPFNETQLFFAFGLAINNRWEHEGEKVFDAILETISFTPESAEGDDSIEEVPADFPFPIPTGEPVSEWNGFPIMPQATAGEETEGSYAFITNASADEIQLFYIDEMETLGWETLGVGQGETGALLIVFQKAGEVASVSVLVVNDETNYVFLVK